MTAESTHGPSQHRAHVRRRVVAIAALAWAIAVAVVALGFGSEESAMVAPEPTLVSGKTDTADSGRTATAPKDTDRAVAAPTNTDTTATENPAPQESQKILTIGWVGDVTPGSQYGLPAGNGRALFASLLEPLRAPDLMIANLEGTFSGGGSWKCGAGHPTATPSRHHPATRKRCVTRASIS